MRPNPLRRKQGHLAIPMTPDLLVHGAQAPGVGPAEQRGHPSVRVVAFRDGAFAHFAAEQIAFTVPLNELAALHSAWSPGLKLGSRSAYASSYLACPRSNSASKGYSA